MHHWYVASTWYPASYGNCTMLQKLSQNAMSQKNAENNIQKPAISLFGGVKIFQDSSFLHGIFRVFGEHKA